MSSAVEALYQSVARGCTESRPEHWTECILEYKEIERYSTIELCFKNPPHEAVYPAANDAALDACIELRTAMAKLNGGEAWYTAVFRMTPDGKYKFDFDYDHLPVFKFMPQGDKWTDEFKRYPRPELQAQIQDWLDGPETDEKSDELIQRLRDLQRTV